MKSFRPSHRVCQRCMLGELVEFFEFVGFFGFIGFFGLSLKQENNSVLNRNSGHISVYSNGVTSESEYFFHSIFNVRCWTFIF